jgi:hypothetical protein
MGNITLNRRAESLCIATHDSGWAGARLLAGNLSLLRIPPGPGWTAGVGESGDGRQALPGIGPRGQAVIDQLLAMVTSLEFCGTAAGTSPFWIAGRPGMLLCDSCYQASPGAGHRHQVRAVRAASRGSWHGRGRPRGLRPGRSEPRPGGRCAYRWHTTRSTQPGAARGRPSASGRSPPPAAGQAPPAHEREPGVNPEPVTTDRRG